MFLAKTIRPFFFKEKQSKQVWLSWLRHLKALISTARNWILSAIIQGYNYCSHLLRQNKNFVWAQLSNQIFALLLHLK